MKIIIPIIAAVVAYAISFGLGYWAIPYLKKLKFGQTILDDGPAWHKSKQGTPTMGGILIAFGMLAGFIASIGLAVLLKTDFANGIHLKTSSVILGIGLALGFGFIGFLDDYIKVVKKRNLGLTALQKTVLQMLVAVIYLSGLAFSGMTTTWIPFLGDVDITSSFGLLFWPIALMFIYGFNNAVNLTDGVDGLATSVTVVVSAVFIVAAELLGFSMVTIFASSVVGALVGFLMWNKHPAKIFMGDTGSLFLGGCVIGLAFAIGRPILLIFAGIIYLVEAFSVILQVAYFKKTGKRIFKMSPLHHHFEKCGWSENKIVVVFSIVSVIGGIVALLPIILNW